MKFNMPQFNKKQIIYVAIAIVTVIILTTGTVLILKSLNVNNTNKDQNTTKVPTTEEIMTQAIQSLHSDPAKAKTLLDQARKAYQDQGNTNAVINVDAQLYLLAHPTATK